MLKLINGIFYLDGLKISELDNNQKMLTSTLEEINKVLNATSTVERAEALENFINYLTENTL